MSRLYLFSMPKLYERNIQQLRGSSYILTLPKEWVLESGLEKGSSVLLAVEPYFIRIVPATKQVKKPLSL
ncbi:MAG: AbrB/MazE/SpoVT family DNA-binding domain-containing protein [Nitrososphaerota archaeon]